MWIARTFHSGVRRWGDFLSPSHQRLDEFPGKTTDFTTKNELNCAASDIVGIAVT